jgi:hypothetical protein
VVPEAGAAGAAAATGTGTETATGSSAGDMPCKLLLSVLGSRGQLALDIAGSMLLKSRFKFEENIGSVNNLLRKLGAEEVDPTNTRKVGRIKGLSERKEGETRAAQAPQGVG